ncbi:acetyl-CoA carboxylase biotin carboxyl carrier protein subunit, partial [Kineococcus glutinatus]|uniref:acetyl-CoA carboxylase biotin carboxyl carrier protein subunit n=1 Tax=Kineococcus glutinatus TaxID=1070872 RepID=UPI0031E944E0
GVRVRLAAGGERWELRVVRAAGRAGEEVPGAAAPGRVWRVREAGREDLGAHTRTGAVALRLEIDGRVLAFVVETGAEEVVVVHRGEAVRLLHREATTAAAPAGTGSPTAPVPGTVVAVPARPGGRVAAGDVLAVLEAMKMQLPVRSPVDGLVTTVDVAVGDRVALGERIAQVEPTGDPGGRSTA